MGSFGEDVTLSDRSFPKSSSSLDEVYEDTEELKGAIWSPNDKTGEGDSSILTSSLLGFLLADDDVVKHIRQLKRNRMKADDRWPCGFLENSLSMFLIISWAICSNLLNTTLVTSCEWDKRHSHFTHTLTPSKWIAYTRCVVLWSTSEVSL